MDAYLSKPINGQEMIALVETLAAGSASAATGAVSSPPAPPPAAEPPAGLVFNPEVASDAQQGRAAFAPDKTQPAWAASAADALALVHELQVHQIELEMQNEELLRAREAVEEASKRYYDLFDFAPVAYFLWDRQGWILEVNLAGAALLGLDRSDVLHKRFGQFVATEHRPEFTDFCRRVLLADDKQTCQVEIVKGGQAFYALIEGMMASGRQGQQRLCRAAVIDISRQTPADESAAALPPRAMPTANSSTAATSETPSRLLQVLLAEDTPASQMLVTHILRKRGHTVEIAQDGRQTLETVGQQDFDVVLMDVQMPVMDGFQATQAIRKLANPKKASLPIIAMTAFAPKGDAERCLGAGMDGYISKPVKGEELIELVERLAEEKCGGRLDQSSQPMETALPDEAASDTAPIGVFDLDDAVKHCFGKYDLFQKMAECLFREAPVADADANGTGQWECDGDGQCMPTGSRGR